MSTTVATNSADDEWDRRSDGCLAEFTSPGEVSAGLTRVGYLADKATAETVFLAARLGKPVLAEGPAGTGKTALAKALSTATGRRLVRLQCYEGLDESRALFDWDYRRQLLHIQSSAVRGEGSPTESSLFAEQYLLTRPLLEAIRSTDEVILLIDEVDRLDIEMEALLLEVLAEFQVTVPELGTLRARTAPLVVLTSNNTRDLSEALKRRCLFLPVDHPSPEREQVIVTSRVPGISVDLAGALTDVVHALRAMDLKKHPSIAETLDWARALLISQTSVLDTETVLAHLPVLLKHRDDIATATREFASSPL